MGLVDRILAATGKKDDLEITSPYESEKEDCLSCRVLGSTVFGTAGIYTYYSGMKQLRQRRDFIEKSKSRYKYGSRQLGIITLSATFMGLSIYRMLN